MVMPAQFDRCAAADIRAGDATEVHDVQKKEKIQKN